MIVFLVSSGHTYTFKPLREVSAPPFRTMTYFKAFGSARLPRATYVFADYDRLSAWELRLAGELFRVLSAGGCRCLNDPARALARFALLRQLSAAGINRFAVTRLEAGEMPSRYPVFLRTEDGHAGALSDLIADEAALRDAVETRLAEGYPLRHLLAVEYAADPLVPGMFRKYAMFRIGDAVFGHPSEHGPDWRLKAGKHGAAGETLYRQENEMIRAGAYQDVLRRAFDVARIEYGRADFGLVGGEPQIYEINSNPVLDLEKPAPFAIRRQTVAFFWENLVSALRAIDDARPQEAIALDSPLLAKRRGRQRWFMPRERYNARP